MTQTEKYIMYKRIAKHGDTLKQMFNLDIDSVELCKKLFRLENIAHKLATDYCNGHFQGDIDKETNKILSKVVYLFSLRELWIPLRKLGLALFCRLRMKVRMKNSTRTLKC